MDTAQSGSPPANPGRTHKGLLVFFLVALAVCAPCAWPLWVMHAPAVRPSRMAAMRVGMSRDEVRHLLGAPSSVLREPDGSECWFYSRSTWATFVVCFSPEGLVTEFEHDT